MTFHCHVTVQFIDIYVSYNVINFARVNDPKDIQAGELLQCITFPAVHKNLK
jgi:hypothetical protein